MCMYLYEAPTVDTVILFIYNVVEIENTIFVVFLQAREESLVMPSGVSADGENYEGATVIEPEKG